MQQAFVRGARELRGEDGGVAIAIAMARLQSELRLAFDARSEACRWLLQPARDKLHSVQ